MDHVERLFELAQDLADTWPNFFARMGPGAGDHATSAYISELKKKANQEFQRDYAEFGISENNGLRVDYYFPDEATIVEIAMGLRNPLSEYERDILKAVLAKKYGHTINRLVFFSKPGAIARCNQPGLKAFKNWLEQEIKIGIEVREFSTASEQILDQ